MNDFIHGFVCSSRHVRFFSFIGLLAGVARITFVYFFCLTIFIFAIDFLQTVHDSSSSLFCNDRCALGQIEKIREIDALLLTEKLMNDVKKVIV